MNTPSVLSGLYSGLCELFHEKIIKENPSLNRGELAEEVEEKATELFLEVLETLEVASLDTMHPIGSLAKKICRGLNAEGTLDLATVENENRKLAQLKTSGVRNLFAGYENTLLPNISEAKKQAAERAFSSFSEISKFAYTRSFELQRNLHIQVRVHAVIFVWKEALLELFGVAGLEKHGLLGLPSHMILAHLGDEFKKPPLFKSTEKQEGVFKHLNELKTNCHKKDVLPNWLHGIFGNQLKGLIKPPSGSGTGNSYLKSYRKQKSEWKDILIPLNQESTFLLHKLRKKSQFKEGVHWIVDSENQKIIFPISEELKELLSK